jgi:hypothetical protein
MALNFVAIENKILWTFTFVKEKHSPELHPGQTNQIIPATFEKHSL